MIFVTVGTHEQPFDRLVSCIDRMKQSGQIAEDVFIQTGYGTYEPEFCGFAKLLPYEDMVKYVQQARIVITHGGPSSFIMPLQVGKIPIVMPRQAQFGEHVNDHQLAFAREVAARQQNIIVAETEAALQEAVLHYDEAVSQMTALHSSNNAAFNAALEHMAQQLLAQRQAIWKKFWF